MKKTTTFLAAIAISCAAASARAQTADEIINKHVEAVGGMDNWKKVNSTVLTGVMNQGGTELPITLTTVNGKGFRMEFSMNGMANYQILTPTEGWAYFPSFNQPKPQAATDEDVKESQDELDVSMDPLMDYKAKGNVVSYLGKDQVEGTECHKIKVVQKTGKEMTLFLDASSYYCIRTTEKTKANGREAESAITWGNYQKLSEGIVFPMSIELDGAPITLKSVEVNKKIDANIFNPETKK